MFEGDLWHALSKDQDGPSVDELSSMLGPAIAVCDVPVTRVGNGYTLYEFG